MIKNFVNGWKIPEIRQKIIFTMLVVLIFRVGNHIPVPGINPEAISQTIAQYDVLGFLNIMTGGGFGRFSLFALGISPYINASIIIQLLTIAIPFLENMMKEGEDGRKKVERITRILGIVFALIMSVGILMPLQNAVISSNVIPRWFSYAAIGIIVTGGTAFLMWLGERMTEQGIGNGTSFLIFLGICANVPDAVRNFTTRTFTPNSTAAAALGGGLSFWLVPVVVILIVLIIAGVVYVDLGERRVPVQYSKRVVGRKMYGGQSSNIPMKVNSNGVLPLIFASTLMSLPAMISQFFPSSGFTTWYNTFMKAGTWPYAIIYFFLIIGFSYFYTAVTFNPIELSKNLQANGGFVPGIRPGRPTSDYLSRISHRLTLFSALFLAIIAAIPTMFSSMLGGSLGAFGATSLLIMVSVALETNKQIEAQITMRHYKGFLK